MDRVYQQERAGHDPNRGVVKPWGLAQRSEKRGDDPGCGQLPDQRSSCDRAGSSKEDKRVLEKVADSDGWDVHPALRAPVNGLWRNPAQSRKSRVREVTRGLAGGSHECQPECREERGDRSGKRREGDRLRAGASSRRRRPGAVALAPVRWGGGRNDRSRRARTGAFRSWFPKDPNRRSGRPTTRERGLLLCPQ